MTTRVLVAKVGLDGHDRGIKIVARILRDAGMEVIYAGLRQTPTAIALAARDEDADVIGLSMHNGSHLTLADLVLRALRDQHLTTPVVIGGIIPSIDIPTLTSLGIAAVLRPGATNHEVIDTISRAAHTPQTSPAT